MRKKGKQRDYTYRSIHEEREYGAYWYSALWGFLRPLLIGAATLLVVGGVLITGWNKLYEAFLAPPQPGNQQLIPFTVESGQSLSSVSRQLENAGLIRSKTVFKYYCDFAGMGQKIQTGDYRLTPSMTMTEIADRLTTGDGNPLVRNITLVPGWTVEDFAKKLVSIGALPDSKEFLELCRTATAFNDYYYIADAMQTKNFSARKYALEGYLAPNTYEVYVDATPTDIIRKLLSQTERAFPGEKQERAQELGYSMDQILTLASLIEKEAKAPEFAKVSAVFHNRLKKKMKLQSDVTIHYLTGVRKMALESNDLNLDSPYNTYRVDGLPLGPICSPSEQAIQAALYPDETFIAEEYLYFCAKDPENGEMHYSRTLQEHEQAVSIYAPLWKAYDQSRGIE